MKALHRYVLISRTYQLTSRGRLPDSQRDRDVNNDLLWKFRRLQLVAESVLDSFLTHRGQFNRTMPGAHPFPPPQTWDFTQHKPFRTVSTIPLQSLYLLTYAFIHEQAQTIVAQQRETDPHERIKVLYERFFARLPSPDEQAQVIAYTERATTVTANAMAAWECDVRTLLRLNEFMYVN